MTHRALLIMLSIVLPPGRERKLKYILDLLPPYNVSDLLHPIQCHTTIMSMIGFIDEFFNSYVPF